MSILNRILKPSRRWMIFNPGTGRYYTTEGPITDTWTHVVRKAKLFTSFEADQMKRAYEHTGIAVILMEAD